MSVAPNRSPGDRPDPNLTLNVYAEGLLDSLLQEVVAPFWKTTDLAEETPRLWAVRYNRRGEHLKLRLHLEPEAVDGARRDLGERFERFFAAIELPPRDERSLRNHSPAIDLEDEVEQPAEDRSVTWTTYRRSTVTLGGPPLLSDDLHIDGMTRCLSAGLGFLLEALAAGGDCARLRQKLLFQVLISGLGAAGLGTPRQAAQYLEYHRDWLLRFFVEKVQEEDSIRRHFAELVGRMGATIEGLHRMALTAWAASAEGAGHADTAAWRSAVEALARHLGQFRGDDAYLTDPFAQDVRFPPLFKIFHGLANQYGLPPMEEAYTHHLLLNAMTVDAVEVENGATREADS